MDIRRIFQRTSNLCLAIASAALVTACGGGGGPPQGPGGYPPGAGDPPGLAISSVQAGPQSAGVVEPGDSYTREDDPAAQYALFQYLMQILAYPAHWTEQSGIEEYTFASSGTWWWENYALPSGGAGQDHGNLANEIISIGIYHRANGAGPYIGLERNDGSGVEGFVVSKSILVDVSSSGLAVLYYAQ